ncbi:MAG: ATP-binding protein [Verrucomicrobiota bacterium]
MIRLEELYSFIEGNFDYLLVVDGQEKVLHASQLLRRACSPEEMMLQDEQLAGVLTPSSLGSFRQAMAQAAEGRRSVAVFTPAVERAGSIPLKAEHTRTAGGDVYLFFGTHMDGISKVAEWEKNERIKELSCLYSVAEWLRAAASMDEFFRKLPDIIAPGMQYPEETVVHSVFLGTKYGQEPPHRHIGTRLLVNQQDSGEIRVGYVNAIHELLPEEQKMLNQIGRMVSLTLEQRQLSERLLVKQAEETEFATRLAELEREIASRTRELEDQRGKLGMVDSYLNQVTRDWEESKARLQTLFAAIPDDVALIDRQRNVVMTNRANVEPGRKCYQTFFSRDVPCEDCRLAKIIRDKAPVTTTIKDGDRYLQVQATSVLDREHEVQGIVEFYRDVTLEKTYEQQIQQADKLAALGQLVSGIGHEINNPNQFIRGNIKIVRQAMDDLLPIVDEYVKSHPDLKVARLKYPFFREHIMTLVDDMNHGSERIKQIVDALRGFVRQDEGLLLDRVEINTLVEAAVRLVENEVHKHAVVCLDLGEHIPSFTGNSQKIEQVLVNLLVNASQAIEEDKKGRVVVRTRGEGKDVVIQVEDNGRGMNDQTLKRIFDPFFTTKRARGGTGLGLAISYRIITEHGGTITVASEQGKGTTFTIRIPVIRSAPPQAPAK